MEIIELAKKLGKALEESAEYAAFCQTRDRCKSDLTLKTKMNEFNVQRTLLDNETAKQIKDETLIDVLNARVETLYKEINDNPLMVDYTKAEDDLNILLNAVNMTITSYIGGAGVEGEAAGCSHQCSSCASACAGRSFAGPTQNGEQEPFA